MAVPVEARVVSMVGGAKKSSALSAPRIGRPPQQHKTQQGLSDGRVHSFLIRDNAVINDTSFALDTS